MFKRVGEDLLRTVTVSWTEFIFGCTLHVETLCGGNKQRVQFGCLPLLSTWRIRGQGFMGVGDMLVRASPVDTQHFGVVGVVLKAIVSRRGARNVSTKLFRRNFCYETKETIRKQSG